MILQLGVKPSWFNTSGTTIKKKPQLIPGIASSTGDLRSYMVEEHAIGDPVVPEMLLKVLEPYRREGAPYLNISKSILILHCCTNTPHILLLFQAAYLMRREQGYMLLLLIKVVQ